jgi:hypothetical protein
MGHLEGRNVGTGVDHQWKVIVGSVSDKGRKISTRKINLSVVIEMIPLRRETGERVQLKIMGPIAEATATETPNVRGMASAGAEASGSMAEGGMAVN